jgi:hypothetical protein
MAIVDLGPQASRGFRGQNARGVSGLFEKKVGAGSKAPRGGSDAEHANRSAAESQRFSYTQRFPGNPADRILGKSLEDK